MANKQTKVIGLKNPCKVIWRTNPQGIEYMNRVLRDEAKTLTEKEREFWFPAGWEKDLAARQKRHRKEGIPDAQFMSAQK